MPETLLPKNQALVDSIKASFLYSEYIFIISSIKRYFLIIAIISIIGGGIGYYKGYMSIPKYTASLKFVMKSENSGVSSSLSSLTSILGISSTSSINPLDRISEIITSDKLIGNALLKKVIINNKETSLINFYISEEKLTVLWAKDSVLSKAKFSSNENYEELNFSQRKAIKNITSGFYNLQKPELGILNKKYDKKSGVITISTTYKNEVFSLEFTNAIYRELTDLYLEQTASNSTNTINILTKKVDSIKTELSNVQNSFARNTDKSLGILLQQDKIENKSLAIKEQLLTMMYGEAQRNLETLRFVQANNNPAFSIIDSPYLPISPVKQSKIKLALFGIILCNFFFILLLRGIAFLKEYKYLIAILKV